MFGAGTILARSATPAPNMCVAIRRERSRKVRVRILKAYRYGTLFFGE